MKAQIKKLEAIKLRIAKKRDEMRDLLNEYEGLLSSIGTRCDELDVALQSIETAIDYLSGQV